MPFSVVLGCERSRFGTVDLCGEALCVTQRSVLSQSDRCGGMRSLAARDQRSVGLATAYRPRTSMIVGTAYCATSTPHRMGLLPGPRPPSSPRRRHGSGAPTATTGERPSGISHTVGASFTGTSESRSAVDVGSVVVLGGHGQLFVLGFLLVVLLAYH